MMIRSITPARKPGDVSAEPRPEARREDGYERRTGRKPDGGFCKRPMRNFAKGFAKEIRGIPGFAKPAMMESKPRFRSAPRMAQGFVIGDLCSCFCITAIPTCVCCHSVFTVSVVVLNSTPVPSDQQTGVSAFIPCDISRGAYHHRASIFRNV